LDYLGSTWALVCGYRRYERWNYGLPSPHVLTCHSMKYGTWGRAEQGVHYLHLRIWDGTLLAIVNSINVRQLHQNNLQYNGSFLINAESLCTNFALMAFHFLFLIFPSLSFLSFFAHSPPSVSLLSLALPSFNSPFSVLLKLGKKCNS